MIIFMLSNPKKQSNNEENGNITISVLIIFAASIFLLITIYRSCSNINQVKREVKNLTSEIKVLESDLDIIKNIEDLELDIVGLRKETHEKKLIIEREEKDNQKYEEKAFGL